MSDAEVQVKRRRTKLRKVSKGLKFSVRCSGQQHIMYLTPKGHLVLAHHSDMDLNSDIALGMLGGEGCKCAEVLKAWRKNDISNLPQTLQGIRVQGRIPRLMRHKMRNEAYKNKGMKRIPWPPRDKSEAIKYLEREFNRQGPNFANAGTKRWNGATQVYEQEDKYKITVKSFSGKGYYSDTEILVTFDEASKKLYFQSFQVPGMNWQRLVTPENLPIFIQIIAYCAGGSPINRMINDSQEKVDAWVYQQIQALIEEHYPTRHGETKLEIDNDYIKHIHFRFDIPRYASGAVPFIIKELRRLTALARQYGDAQLAAGVPNIFEDD